MRVELPSKVNGSAKYGIDIQVPGMLYGAVLRAPVEGSTAEKFDEAKVRTIAGVVKTVKLAHGVGVIAETPWAAFAAYRAVGESVTWNRGGEAWTFNSDKGLDTFIAAARDSTLNGSDWFKAGDPRAELAKAATTMEAEFLCDYAYHSQMEPLNAVA